MFRTVYRKIAAALFVLVLAIGAAFFVLVSYATHMYPQEIAQKLNIELAQHIVDEEALLNGSDVNREALEHLFHMLMVINPNIEIYLLDTRGRILADAAPYGRIMRHAVDLAPVRRFLAGERNFPLLGDDPRSPERRKVFSVAPIAGPGGVAGYLYVILASEAYENVTARIQESYILRFTTVILALGLVVALLAGLAGTALLTRRLGRLSEVMRAYGQRSGASGARYATGRTARDEIDQLGASFNRMADRIDAQVEALQQNDAKRRELVANVSHDLRTPLTSLHGYLETLALKDASLAAEERREYLEIATARSKQLNRLVAELFELAKLDSCETLLNVEPFSLAELVQDVAQKFRLDAQSRGVELKTQVDAELPFAYGDIGLMQRVLDNLVENALRHTPRGGQVTLRLAANPDKITVRVADNGCGIPAEELPHIFDRFYRLDKNRESGGTHAGLGLAIARRIVDLHGSAIRADSRPQQGTTFVFQVPAFQG